MEASHANGIHSVHAHHGDDDAMITTNYGGSESNSNGTPHSPLPHENESSEICEEWEKTVGYYSVSYQKPRAKGCYRPAAVKTKGKCNFNGDLLSFSLVLFVSFPLFFFAPRLFRLARDSFYENH
jgi:hypothetical protein